MTTLWQKSSAELNSEVASYTVGDDIKIDIILMPYDIDASKAHAEGLQKIGVLTEEELFTLLACLGELKKLWKQGRISITDSDEDCHTVIENYLAKELGDIGKKIHTGRSRNDQILVALRLFMKEKLQKIRTEALVLSKAFLASARTHQNVPLPGYTHMQQAMLSSVSHYYCSFVESLLDDIEYMDSVKKHIDKNPLGSAAGFGVAFPLDREYTTKKLGFGSIQVNSLYCQNSRGKFESLYLESLVQIMMTLGKFATDLLLFTSQEYDFFEVDETLVTGSSIMPQKKNLDGMEILRGYVSVVMGHQRMVQDIVKSLPSGYNRDFQLMKKPLIESIEIVLKSIEVTKLYLNGVTPKKDVIESKIGKDIFMADAANALVKKKDIPFREAYKIAAEQMESYEVDFKENIASKVSMGAPGNLCFEYYKEKIQIFANAKSPHIP
jgi:argininosuccinate lyase